MTARRAGEGERLVRAGNWEGWHPTQLLGQHVSGKTLGIIGMGRIGEAIAHRCHYGFGMDVVFFNRSPKQTSVPARQMESIEDVASSCDILVVALPGGPTTRHLINATTFEAMQPHAIFVNIARGEIVDETALITALDKGQIAGAGLDVYEFEPKVPDALIARENVTLLPHLGTATLEVRTAMGMLAVENLEAFAAGESARLTSLICYGLPVSRRVPDSLAPVTAAERHICLVPADLDLVAIGQHFSVVVLANHHRGFLSAMTNRAHFAHFVGKRQKLG